MGRQTICVKLLYKHDKLTQCCCAFNLARLSCRAQAHRHIPVYLYISVLPPLSIIMRKVCDDDRSGDTGR